jgi:hypothetical protein
VLKIILILILIRYNSGVLINAWKLTFMKLILHFFEHKTNCVNFNYYVSNVLILRFDCTKDLGLMLDSKLCCHCHVNFVHSQALIRYITYNLFSLDSPVILYTALQNVSAVWNNLTLTDTNKIENIQKNWQWLLLSFFQYYILRNYLVSSSLKFITLYSRRRYLDASFLINIFKDKISCRSILGTVGVLCLQGK